MLGLIESFLHPIVFYHFDAERVRERLRDAERSFSGDGLLLSSFFAGGERDRLLRIGLRDLERRIGERLRLFLKKNILEYDKNIL
uniref:Uncharacterized protein n=1 Tax=Panagrolaimus sp. PS1159 TaxID=55785 RepID=A0AC35FQE2_9BILA